MADDWTAYQKAVLDPARSAGNAPPRDLCARYGMDAAHLRDAGRFSAQVTRVVKYWKGLEIQSKKYGSLAVALLAAHSNLVAAGTVTPEHFRTEHDAGLEQAVARLRQWTATIAGGLPYVTLTAVARLVEQSGGLLDERKVRTALADAKVTVIEPPWVVPLTPPIPTAAVLPAQLQVLGLTLSPELVFPDGALAKGYHLKGGFRLADDRRLTRDAVLEAQRLQAQRAHTSRKTAAETVLATLARAVTEPGALDALLLWELCAHLRPGFAAGLPVQLIADLAVETGLDREEAVELAVTLAAQPRQAGPAGADNDERLVLDALGRGCLREAQQLLETLPPGEAGDQLRDKVTAAVGEADELVRRADAALRAGQSEPAAGLLAEAVRRVRDDADLANRLARIAPPAATAVVAGTHGDRVHLSWSPSAATTGQLHYRVRRTTGGPAASVEDGTAVADTDGTQATDPAPPIAAPLVYTVFASRAEQIWSTGAAAAPLTVVPPVTDLVLGCDASTVSGTWRSHPATAEVAVHRRRLEEPDGATGTPVHAGLTNFVDVAVQVGAAYAYAVVAMYLTPAGDRSAAETVTGSITVEPEPVAVTDLTVEVLPDATRARLRLAWTPPSAGTVEIRRTDTAPPWAVGERVAPTAAAGHGAVVIGARQTGPDGRTLLSADAGLGRSFYTAVTMSRSVAVIGSSVPLEAIAPVRGLRAVRRWDAVTVSWLWPEGAVEVLVSWSTADSSGELSCTEIQSRTNGGVTLETGPDEVTISVATVVQERHERLVSAPVTVIAAARPAHVRWDLWMSGLVRRRAVLALVPDRRMTVPPLRLTAEDGTVCRIPSQRLDTDRVTTVALLDAAGKFPDRVDLVPVEPDDSGLVLVRATLRRRP